MVENGQFLKNASPNQPSTYTDDIYGAPKRATNKSRPASPHLFPSCTIPGFRRRKTSRPRLGRRVLLLAASRRQFLIQMEWDVYGTRARGASSGGEPVSGK